MVDDAIAMEEDLRLHHLEKRKAKVTTGPSGSAQQRPRMTYPVPSRPLYQSPRGQLMPRSSQPQYVPRPQYYRPPQPRMTYPVPSRPPYQSPRGQLMPRSSQPQYVPRPQYYRPPQPQWNTRAPTPPPAQFAQNPCYNCGRPGHFARNYPHPRRI